MKAIKSEIKQDLKNIKTFVNSALFLQVVMETLKNISSSRFKVAEKDLQFVIEKIIFISSISLIAVSLMQSI